jgi:general secretion pathway protein H
VVVATAPTHGAAAASARRRRRGAGFTLIELLVVIAIVALTAGIVSLALRDADAGRLERDAVRLAALLEAARAESRATGIAVWWVPAGAGDTADDTAGQAAADGTDGGGFRFVGLPDAAGMPRAWLDDGVRAEVLGPPRVQLGPEALIGAQRIVLRLGEHRLELATDGLGPFTVAPPPFPAG